MIEFKIKIIGHIPSGNIVVIPKKKKNGGVYLTKNPVIRNFQEELQYYLAQEINRDDIDTSYTQYKLTLDFLLSRNLKGRDVSNMFKIVEDGIVSFTGIDDKKHFKISSSKQVSPDKFEYIIGKLEVLT